MTPGYFLLYLLGCIASGMVCAPKGERSNAYITSVGMAALLYSVWSIVERAVS